MVNIIALQWVISSPSPHPTPPSSPRSCYQTIWREGKVEPDQTLHPKGETDLLLTSLPIFWRNSPAWLPFCIWVLWHPYKAQSFLFYYKIYFNLYSLIIRYIYRLCIFSFLLFFPTTNPPTRPLMQNWRKEGNGNLPNHYLWPKEWVFLCITHLILTMPSQEGVMTLRYSRGQWSSGRLCTFLRTTPQC